MAPPLSSNGCKESAGDKLMIFMEVSVRAERDRRQRV
jgi:hypothetical protein